MLESRNRGVSCPPIPPYCGLARLLSEQIPINLMVAVLKKDRLATIPTLCNVMRKAGNHCTRQSCHGEN
jgi:hypothetical protein